MPTPPLSDAILRKTYEAWVKHGKCYAETGRAMKLNDRTVRHRVELGAARFGLSLDLEGAKWPSYHKKAAPAKAPEFSLTPLPDDDVSIDDLIAHRKKQFAKKREHEEARKLIPVKVGVRGPVGILHFGDPHVDDDGTDIEALERDKALCGSTEGLFAANVGDVTNNWIGRLAKLYDSQSTSAPQAWRLAEWLISGTHWLYIIGGNHDAWSGAGDPLKWIARQAESLYQSSEVRLALRFWNGREVRINARHDFAGSSQWNPAHGPMKSVFHGVRDHIAICGHKHKSGYGIIKDPDKGIACHAIQVASYKLFDRYARDHNFRDQSLGPACLTVIDPTLSDAHPDLVKPFWDTAEGAEYLKFKRAKFKKSRA